MKPKIAVLVLGYKAKENVDDCFFNLLNQDYKNYEVWFADNNSNDGAVEYIKRNFSKVKVISFDKNYGYAGGNNRMLKMAFNKGADFCMILNADIKVEKDLLTSVMATYERKKKLGTKVGLIQPVIMLFKKPELINTAGNIAHYLGFGYCGSYLSNKIPEKDNEIVSVSGTAMLVSKKYYEEVGLFDEDFFMYNEDQNYSWRGLMRGYKHFLSAKGRIWHKYEFSKNKNKWFHSEKNRIKMVLENYEKKTLFLLLPILVINEILLVIYSLTDGWFVLKLMSYNYLIKNFKFILKRRKYIQENRVVKDKEIVGKFSGNLSFAEKDGFLIRKVVNHVYGLYFEIIKAFL